MSPDSDNQSKLHSHSLLISSDKWSTHHVGLHTVTQHSLTYSQRAALLFFLSIILLLPCFSAVTLVHFLPLILFNYISKQNAYHDKKKKKKTTQMENIYIALLFLNKQYHSKVFIFEINTFINQQCIKFIKGDKSENI